MNQYFGKSGGNLDPAVLREQQKRRQALTLQVENRALEEEVSTLAYIVDRSRKRLEYFSKIEGLVVLAEQYTIPLDTLCRCHVYFSKELKTIHSLALKAVEESGNSSLIAKFNNELKELSKEDGEDDRGTDPSGS